MAITTLDGVIAGSKAPVEFFKATGAMEAIGTWHSLLYSTGSPAAGVAPSPGLAGAALTSYDGQLAWGNPVSGNSYLTRLLAYSNGAFLIRLYDRLWHNSGIAVTTTTSQTITSAAWPARDRDGATDGVGVQVGIEVSTATTNGAPVTTITMDYTNSAGTASRTAAISSFPTTATAGTFVPFQLQGGDGGVRSIQSITLGTTLGAGAIHLVAYRTLSFLAVAAAGVGEVNAITGGFPRLYDNTVPMLHVMPQTGTGSGNVVGAYSVAQG